jgi:hypothetical protein
MEENDDFGSSLGAGPFLMLDGTPVKQLLDRGLIPIFSQKALELVVISLSLKHMRLAPLQNSISLPLATK